MTPKELTYIREWAASGNERRSWIDLPRKIQESGLIVQGSPNLEDQRLSVAGVALANLADALDQACELVFEMWNEPEAECDKNYTAQMLEVTRGARRLLGEKK